MAIRSTEDEIAWRCLTGNGLRCLESFLESLKEILLDPKRSF
jgi:hypothetical protein